MALLFFDGFDTGDTVPGTWQANHGTKYTGASNVNGNTTVVRTGRASLTFTSSGGVLTKTVSPAPGSGFIVGLAVYLQTFSSANAIIRVCEGGGAIPHLLLMPDAGRRLQVWRGSTILATGTTVLPLNSWVYLEFKGTINDATGTYEVRIDGLTELSASGVDTRNGGTGVWDTVQVPSFNNSASGAFADDFVICDTSGPRNNDFLGPVKVETLLPQTDAVALGSSAGLTPSTGTDHGALVDENPPNTSDYNSSPTIGAKDTYNYPALTLTGAILGIQTNLFVAKSDTAARTVCAVVRSSGVDYDGANVAPPTTFSYASEVREVNPATGAAWTPAEVGTIEAGMKVTA